jgi:hypothetical protein
MKGQNQAEMAGTEKSAPKAFGVLPVLSFCPPSAAIVFIVTVKWSNRG